MRLPEVYVVNKVITFLSLPTNKHKSPVWELYSNKQDSSLFKLVKLILNKYNVCLFYDWMTAWTVLKESVNCDTLKVSKNGVSKSVLLRTPFFLKVITLLVSCVSTV